MAEIQFSLHIYGKLPSLKHALIPDNISFACQTLLVPSNVSIFLLLRRRFDMNCTSFFYRIVPHSEIDPHDHYTISLQGITHNATDEVEFTKLSRWEKEYKYYQNLIRIPTFANFRKWKAFVVWRRNVRGK